MMTLTTAVPDVAPLPRPPYARCTGCGQFVAVLPSLGFEFVVHRRPLPDGSLCEAGRRAHAADVVAADPAAGR